MALLPVLVYPDERLKQISAPVTDFDRELRNFIADLEETMQSFPGCVGLAAPQVIDLSNLSLSRHQRAIAWNVHHLEISTLEA